MRKLENRIQGFIRDDETPFCLISAWKMIVKQRAYLARCGTNGLNERDTRDSLGPRVAVYGLRERVMIIHGGHCVLLLCRRRTAP